MITAIILAVTAELLAYAFEILTSEFLAIAMLILGVAEFSLVATVAAIVVMIAQPTAIQAPPVVASELMISARRWRRTVMQRYILISPINAVRISITQPFLRNALGAIPHLVRGASELRFFVAFPVVWKLNCSFINNQNTFASYHNIRLKCYKY